MGWPELEYVLCAWPALYGRLKVDNKILVMEEVVEVCFYNLFCCSICEEKKKPVRSEETVNPVSTGEPKGEPVKNDP